MIKVGDRVFQIKYDWGKNSNGGHILFEVESIGNVHPYLGGRGITCMNLSTSESVIYIPESTWVKVEDFRKSKIKQIIE